MRYKNGGYELFVNNFTDFEEAFSIEGEGLGEVDEKSRLLRTLQRLLIKAGPSLANFQIAGQAALKGNF